MSSKQGSPAPDRHTPRLDRWWIRDPRERYWLEVSERGNDLGVDLNAPTENEVGRPFWSYDLLWEVSDGDAILHYDRSRQAIVAWSVGVGSAWPDRVIWAARGTYARGRNIQPHERSGLRVSLQGPFFLREPLTLDRIRSEQQRLIAVRGERSYFPFELGVRRTRPVQGYLFKLPAAFLELFPELEDVILPGHGGVGQARRAATAASKAVRVGFERPDFRAKNEEVRSRRAQPWSRDPSEVDRALSEHARIERLVAEAGLEEGWAAKQYGPGDPEFDLLLHPVDYDGPLVVVEVKSTTATNEEKQLRLALGQVLRYRQLLIERGGEVVPLIAIERAPRDPLWNDLCVQAGVQLIWPEVVRKTLRDLTWTNTRPL